MRIALTGINYAPEMTGIAPYTSGLAEGLAERGHDVYVTTGLPHYPEWRIADGWESEESLTATSNRVHVTRVRHHVPSVASLRGRLRMEMSFGRRAVVTRAPRPDVVVAITPALVASAMVVARARAQRIPVGLIVQDLYGLGISETHAGGGLAATSVMRFEAAAFRWATGVAVIHEHFRDSVIAMGIDGRRVSVIRNWSHFDSAGTPDITTAAPLQTRRRLGWRDDEIVVLHSGNMGMKQGLENVIEAARVADRRGLPVRFVLVGDGNQRGRLETLAAGVDRVDMIRPLPDDEYRNALAAADLLLVNELPGVSGMAVPSKLTTYFAAGRPVIGAVDEHGVTAGEIESSCAGIVVPAGDPAALVEAAYRLASDRERCVELATNGPTYARGVLSVKTAIDEYEGWCTTLASEDSRMAVS